VLVEQVVDRLKTENNTIQATFLGGNCLQIRV